MQRERCHNLSSCRSGEAQNGCTSNLVCRRPENLEVLALFEFQRFALKKGESVYKRALASWPLSGLVSAHSFLRPIGYLDDLRDVPIDQLVERVDAKPDELTNKHRFFKVSVLLFIYKILALRSRKQCSQQSLSHVEK